MLSSIWNRWECICLFKTQFLLVLVFFQFNSQTQCRKLECVKKRKKGNLKEGCAKGSCSPPTHPIQKRPFPIPPPCSPPSTPSVLPPPSGPHPSSCSLSSFPSKNLVWSLSQAAGSRALTDRLCGTAVFRWFRGGTREGDKMGTMCELSYCVTKMTGSFTTRSSERV